MFTTNTVTQMAAFFIGEQGAPMHVLKLMKLMYLADREAMRERGYPISYDDMVSMRHGPVLTRTLDLINGFVDGAEADPWNNWIDERKAHRVALKRDVKRSGFSHLSIRDRCVLERVWRKFGDMNQWQLRDYTHEHCAEWRDPESVGGKSLPIEEIDVLRAVGVAEKEALEIAGEILAIKSKNRYLRELESALSSS